MKQTKERNQTVDAVESLGFEYRMSQTLRESKSDYYTSLNSRYMLVHVQNPLCDESPNLIIQDAKLGVLAANLTTPVCDDTILQCRVKDVEHIAKMLEAIGIAEKVKSH